MIYVMLLLILTNGSYSPDKLVPQWLHYEC